MQRLLYVAVLLLLIVSGPVLAQSVEKTEPAEPFSRELIERGSLFNNWLGAGEKLQEQGITIGLYATHVYQINLQGGLSTNSRSGRHAGSYDLEVELDFEKLFGLRGASMFVGAEGSWGEGLNPESVGSLFGVNDDAGGDRSIDVTSLYYQQVLLDGRLRFRVGKQDLTGGFEVQDRPATFDGNAYANDETTQFLNSALVNNPTVPFPEDGLAVSMLAEPVDGWYVGAAVADAQADARETGLNTAFHGPDYFFSVLETGLATSWESARGELPGMYRLGMWYDPQPKQRFRSTSVKRDDIGFYVSVDQMIYRESAGDRQGLGLFGRYGYADDDVNEIEHFWSAGLQYRGLVPTRDMDVLGFGIARGRLADGAGFTADHETACELYYNALVTGWLSVTPSVQLIRNPGGDSSVDDALVMGLRLQIAF
ncbi:MAG: carbohydrate porin [Phycisphaerae bacterium]